ncbi:hypothetical protein GCM10025734_03480 [Kitasatospora paranensis]|uniref:hypothetical protein n=1 Tax=Kitasatospora paranensis TaxID=258053 RepID=UPI0031EDC097
MIDARDSGLIFYLFDERIGRWARGSPAALLAKLRRDLRAHAGGHFGAAAALVAVERLRLGPDEAAPRI